MELRGREDSAKNIKCTQVVCSNNTERNENMNKCMKNKTQIAV